MKNYVILDENTNVRMMFDKGGLHCELYGNHGYLSNDELFECFDVIRKELKIKSNKRLYKIFREELIIQCVTEWVTEKYRTV